MYTYIITCCIHDDVRHSPISSSCSFLIRHVRRLVMILKEPAIDHLTCLCIIRRTETHTTLSRKTRATRTFQHSQFRCWIARVRAFMWRRRTQSPTRRGRDHMINGFVDIFARWRDGAGVVGVREVVFEGTRMCSIVAQSRWSMDATL